MIDRVCICLYTVGQTKVAYFKSNPCVDHISPNVTLINFMSLDCPTCELHIALSYLYCLSSCYVSVYASIFVYIHIYMYTSMKVINKFVLLSTVDFHFLCIRMQPWEVVARKSCYACRSLLHSI